MIKELINNRIIFLLFLYLIFPFFLSIDIKGIDVSIKTLFLFVISIITLKDLILKNNCNKLILKISITILIIYLNSLLVYLFKSSDDYLFINLYLSNYFNSFIIINSCILIFIWLVENLDKEKSYFIFKIVNFISLLIICEFILYFLFLKFLSNEIFVFEFSSIYPEGVFRSILIGDHILTTIFMCLNFFINVFFLINKKNKKSIIFAFFSLLIIFYNLETRLTILSFLFSIIIFFYSYKNEKVNFLIKYNFYFIIIIFFIAYFSKSETNYLMSIEFLNFKVTTSSLFDRLNINLLTFFSFLQQPLGLGWNLAGNFFHLNTFTPLFYFGNLELLSSYIIYSQEYFIHFHGAFIQPHGFICNILASFGIFNLLIYKFLSKKIINYKNLNYSEFYLILNIIILFLTTSLMINYIANIEIICVIFFGIYFNLKKKKNEK